MTPMCKHRLNTRAGLRAAKFLISIAGVGLAGCGAAAPSADPNAGSTAARDIDGDGVENSLDLCANTPDGSAVDASGCAPSQLDSDQDSVSNAADLCPDTAAGLEVNPDGCTRVFHWTVESDPFISAVIDIVPAAYHVNSAGEFQEATYSLDGLVALLNLLDGLGGLGGGSEGGGSVELHAEILDETAALAERTTLVSAEISGGELPIQGAVGIIVELSQFDVQFSEGVVTWTFDVDVEMSVSGLLIITAANFTGTATGELSADGSTITWTGVTGTLTASGDALSGEEQTVALEEVYVPDENDPQAGVMPRWTLEAE